MILMLSLIGLVAKNFFASPCPTHKKSTASPRSPPERGDLNNFSKSALSVNLTSVSPSKSVCTSEIKLPALLVLFTKAISTLGWLIKMRKISPPVYPAPPIIPALITPKFPEGDFEFLSFKYSILCRFLISLQGIRGCLLYAKSLLDCQIFSKTPLHLLRSKRCSFRHSCQICYSLNRD